MKLKQLKKYDDIQLKEEIHGTLGIDEFPDGQDYRTPGKDVTAKWIQRNVVTKGRWEGGDIGASHLEREMKEDPNYDGPDSRQHITNVLEDYYEPAEPNATQQQSEHSQRDSTNGEMNAKPFSAAPDESFQPEPRPEIDAETNERYFVAFVENGSVDNVVEIPIPDAVDDISTYIQGVVAGAQQLRDSL